MPITSAWTKRAALTVQAGQITGTVTQHVAYVNHTLILVNNPNALTLGHPDAIKSDGGDIRASSDMAGALELAVEVRVINETTGVLGVYIRTTSLAAGGIIYLWWGNAAATLPAAGAAFGSIAVWSDAEAVYHCEEAPVIGVDTFYNSKTNAVDAAHQQRTVVCADTLDSVATGMNVGLASTGDSAACAAALTKIGGAALQFTTGQSFSFSCIAMQNSAAGAQVSLVGSANTAATRLNYTFRILNETLSFEFHEAGGTAHDFNATTPVNYNDSVWRHWGVSFTFGTGASIVMTVNGVSIPGAWDVGGSEAPANDALFRFMFGSIFFTGDYRLGWEGRMDECRVVRGVRTVADFQAESNNYLAPTTFFSAAAAMAVGTTHLFFLPQGGF